MRWQCDKKSQEKVSEMVVTGLTTDQRFHVLLRVKQKSEWSTMLLVFLSLR
eukprot:m.60956 g.60956  ORF g.60956 m.60956 type:complete len:51 (+) comp11842_c0_seq1:37-189(+)